MIKKFRHVKDKLVGVLSKTSTQMIILFLMGLLYTLTLSIVSINDYNRFWHSAFDLGIFDQGIWLLSRGENAFVTVRGFHIFGDHIQYIITFLAPLFWIWDDARILLIAQSMALSLGSIPLYLIARDKLKNKLVPLVVVFTYLLYPALHYLNLENFHADSFAVPILLFCFYFLTKKNYSLYAFFVFLALITKEDIAITVFMLGIYATVFYNRKVGVATILASILCLVLTSQLLYYFNGMGYFHTKYGAFNKFGSSPIEVVVNMAMNPGRVMETLITPVNEKYVYDIFSPVAFLSILSPTTLLIGIPAILMNLLTGWPYAHSIQYHYTKAIIPFVFISLVYGLSNLERLCGWMKFKIRLIYSLIVLILLCTSIYLNIEIGPGSTSIKNYGGVIETIKTFNNYSPRERTLLEAIDSIPRNATVSATYLIVPHMTHRKIIYMFPNPFKEAYWGAMLGNFTPPTPTKDADYIIADMKTVNPEDEKNILDKFIEEGRYSKIFERDEVLILKNCDRNNS